MVTPAGRDLQIAHARNLVREHREAVAAMEQMYAERDEHNQNRIRQFEKLVSDVRYGLNTGMPPTAFMLRVETLLDDFKFSGLSADDSRRSPVGSAVPSPSPARPVVVSSPPMGDRPGTDLTPHGRGCMCSCCLPDTWAMGTADLASPKRWGWT